MALLEESTTMLKGIALYTRSHRAWQAFLDDEAKAEGDPSWIRERRWSGVISRHTTPTEDTEARAPDEVIDQIHERNDLELRNCRSKRANEGSHSRDLGGRPSRLGVFALQLESARLR
jgi:hypothetical protein